MNDSKDNQDFFNVLRKVSNPETTQRQMANDLGFGWAN